MKIKKIIKKYWKYFVGISLAILFLNFITIWLSGGFEHSGDTVTVVYVPKVRDDNDFWKELISGAESAAKEFQVDLRILAPDEERDVEQQKDCIRQAITMNPDVIALSPTLYSGMTDVVEEITDAGIPLVLVDSQLDKELAVTYIGTDNVDAGIKTGQKTLEFIADDAKIAIMSQSKETSTAIDREKGVRIGLGEAADRIETVLYCESNKQLACDLTKELLHNQSDINCIIGLNLEATIGAAKAIKELGAGNEVCVIGLDNDREGIQYLEMGIIDALVVQKPFHMGYYGIKAAAQVARGEDVEARIYSETQIITIDNIYSQENEKLLFIN